MIRRPKLDHVLAGGAVALLWPAVAGDSFWLQFFGKAMITGIFAMSLDLLVGYVGLVSLAHAGFFGLAAYLLAASSNALSIVNPLLSLPLCLAGVAFAALIIGWLCLRAKGIYFIMATFAFSEMMHHAINDAPGFGGSDGLYVQRRPRLGPFDLADRRTAYLAIWLVLVAVYVLLERMLRAPYGRVLAAIRINEARTRSLGFATPRYSLVAFVIAATLAGLAGYLDATLYGFVNPAELAWEKSGFLLVIVLVGGKGTLYGPTAAAFLFMLLEHYAERITVYWNAVVGALVVVVVFFLPRGLASARGLRG